MMVLMMMHAYVYCRMYEHTYENTDDELFMKKCRQCYRDDSEDDGDGVVDNDCDCVAVADDIHDYDKQTNRDHGKRLAPFSCPPKPHCNAQITFS